MKKAISSLIFAVCAQSALACPDGSTWPSPSALKSACESVIGGAFHSVSAGHTTNDGRQALHCYVWDSWVNQQDDNRLAGEIIFTECRQISSVRYKRSKWLDDDFRRLVMGPVYYPYGWNPWQP